MARPLMREAQNVASTFEPLAAQAAAAAPGLMGEAGCDSPARRLQQELERALSGAGEPRWSARRSLGFVVLVNGGFWIALIWAIRAALS